MTGTHVFRPKGSSLVLTVILWIGAVGIVWPVVAAPKPLNPQGSPTPEQAKAMILVASMLALYGLFSALSWVNGVLILDEDGIRLKNLLGKVRFRATWRDLIRLESRVQVGGGVGSSKRQYFSLHTKTQIVFLREFGNNMEMAEIIRTHAPALLNDRRN